jgi:hypothetical protein
VLKGGDGGERRATYTVMQSDDLLARNHRSADYSEQVQPVTQELGTVRDAVVVGVPGQSVGALVLSTSARLRR